jgi:integrase
MPRRSKGARLWLRPARRNKTGKVIAGRIWVILDNGKHIATGCAESETKRAEEVLAAYIAQKYHPERRERDLEVIDVADVLSVYVDDCAHRHANQKRFHARVSRLNDFWGGMTLANVTGASCRRYAKHRGNLGGARRDLEDLRAAISHHAKEGLHRGLVRVVLPDKGPPRDRWLTRAEAARLLWACWRKREVQTAHRGAHKGSKIETERYPLRHIARFILIALYTGTRPGAVMSASFVRGTGRSYVDLDRGIFYRLAEGRRATNKRQPPVPLPPRLLAHMRRWARLGITKDYLVEWNGKRVQSIKVGYKRAIALSALTGKVTPHTLRHTAATWLMHAGVPIWEAAGFLGMSPAMIEQTYAHHHPTHMRGAAEAIAGRSTGGRESLVISLVEPPPAKGKAARNR